MSPVIMIFYYEYLMNLNSSLYPYELEGDILLILLYYDLFLSGDSWHLRKRVHPRKR